MFLNIKAKNWENQNIENQRFKLCITCHNIKNVLRKHDIVSVCLVTHTV